jgi:hypothetical protein
MALPQKKSPTEVAKAYEAAYKDEVARQETDTSSHDEKPQIIEVLHGHQKFNMPDDDVRKELKAVILGSVKYRAMYQGSGDNSKRLCDSLGGKVGRPTDDGRAAYAYLDAVTPQCVACPANVWGSDGAGKLCKEKRNMLLYIPGYKTALLLRVATMAIGAHDELYSKAKAKGVPVSSFFTTISLSGPFGDGERKYSKLAFTPAEKLAEEDFLSVLQFRAQYAENLQHIEEDFGGDNKQQSEEPPPPGDEHRPPQTDEEEDDVPF